jgi:glutaredoxin
MLNVTIYSKKDCHLCDIARETLLKVQQKLPFSLNEIDIEKDKTAFEKYKYLIPVIEIDGEKAFNYKVDENELEKVLKLKSQPR